MGSEDSKKQKKKSMKNAGSGSGSGSGKVDDRFASALSDPRFMEAPQRRAKVAIDSRFQSVFTDSRFASSSAPVDKRGKPTDKNDKKASASLKHYYRLQEEEKDDEEEENDTGTAGVDSNADEIEGLSSDESTSTDSTDSDDELIDDGEQDTFMPPEENIPDIEKETHRLAIVNLDWSQVRAVDLYVLLSSFLRKDGQIVAVTVYPSEFGLKRMEEEASRGPVGLFDDDDEYDKDDDDDEIDDKKLRAYELSRLRYYYAVVDCDSSATADHLYKTCDGLEFERSANKLDLRFIPDSMNFKHQPRDVATEAPTDYEGVDFQTRALQQSNVQLTWDEDEPQRAKTLNRKLNTEQLAELELKEFLASDESETDEDDDVGTHEKSLEKHKKQDMYRALIQSGDDSDDRHDENDDQDMEVTFNSGLEDISKRILEKKNKKSETVWDAYLRKRSEKRKASKNRSKYSSEDDDSDTDQELAEQVDDFFVENPSSVENKGNQVRTAKRGKPVHVTDQEAEASKAELELLLADDKGADTNLKGYNMKPRKKKGKKGSEILDEGKIPTIDSEDPRFEALFSSPLFALDPTDPQFKRSATYTRQIAQKRKMIDQENDAKEHSNFVQAPEIGMHKDKLVKSDILPQRKEQQKLASLVKSIKMKSKHLSLPATDNVPQKYKLSGHKAKKQ